MVQQVQISITGKAGNFIMKILKLWARRDEINSRNTVDAGGPVVMILSTGSEVHAFKPDRGGWIFQGVKIQSMTSFGREVKPWVPCRRFMVRKRTSSRN